MILRRKVGVAVAALLGLGALATTQTTAQAHDTKPAMPASLAAHHPKHWGMVAIKIDPSSTKSTRTIHYVGGGEWAYGYDLTTDGKYCYSNYWHPDKVHSSTAKIAGVSVKAVAGPDDTSLAHRTAGAAYTCYAYWATY